MSDTAENILVLMAILQTVLLLAAVGLLANISSRRR